jgi:hypothetical protein
VKRNSIHLLGQANREDTCLNDLVKKMTVKSIYTVYWHYKPYFIEPLIKHTYIQRSCMVLLLLVVVVEEGLHLRFETRKRVQTN